MKTDVNLYKKILLTFSALFFIGQTAALDEPNTKIRGTVMPYKWSGKKEVETVAIRVIQPLEKDTAKRNQDIVIRDYLIKDIDKAPELLSLDMIGQTIEATGTITKDDNNELVLNLKDYRLIKNDSKK